MNNMSVSQLQIGTSPDSVISLGRKDQQRVIVRAALPQHPLQSQQHLSAL